MTSRQSYGLINPNIIAYMYVIQWECKALVNITHKLQKTIGIEKILVLIDNNKIVIIDISKEKINC